MSSTERDRTRGRYMPTEAGSPAVVWDYDGVISGSETYRVLVDGWYDAGHLSDEEYTAIQNADGGEHRNDIELQGDLLYRVTDALRGERKSDLFKTTADLVVEYQDEFLSKSANELLADLDAAGLENHVVSHNYRMVFDALADHSNIRPNNVYANRLEVGENGRLTGDLAFNMFGIGKKQIVNRIADQQYVRAGIGDSKSDLPLITAAEDGFALNPSDELREEAETNADIHVSEDIEEVGARLLG